MYPAGGWLASCAIVSARGFDLGEVNTLCTLGWDQVSPVGMWKTGNKGGRREVSGVGIGTGGVKNAIWSTDVMVWRFAVGGRWERWAVKAARYLAIVKRMGGIASMLCSGSTRVVRKEPLMRQTMLFWATWRVWTRCFGARYDQRGRPYRRTGSVMV